MTNDHWQNDVRWLLHEGYGVEDIALELDCTVEAVRLEVRILRESGELEALVNERPV